jgi:DNA-binding NtrC family response regulator
VPETRRTLLVVEDDRNFSAAVREYLEGPDLEVLVAQTGAACLELCARRRIDVVLLDQKLPDASGHELCPAILGHNDQTKIIFTTAYPSFDNAVTAVRAGAYDYLTKPFELQELRLALDRALRTLALEKVEQVQKYRTDKESRDAVFVGESAAAVEVRRLIGVAAQAEAAVLITGETGSGKNVVARCIHFGGPRRTAPFIGINCAALPEQLIEAELFGYEKGSFTGAAAARKGIFEMAEGGTLFLDEIGEMPLHLQSKLLGVLDDGRVKRLGGESIRSVNARVVAATGIDCARAIAEKQFRGDLFYRLSVITIHLPPLRERREDIPVLSRHLLAHLAGERRVELAAAELARLQAYDWPGNVRELRNVLERALILGDGTRIRPAALLGNASRSAAGKTHRGEGVAPDGAPPEQPAAARSLESVEKAHLAESLHRNAGNLARTARDLGISLSTLKRKRKLYDLK